MEVENIPCQHIQNPGSDKYLKMIPDLLMVDDYAQFWRESNSLLHMIPKFREDRLRMSFEKVFKLLQIPNKWDKRNHSMYLSYTILKIRSR